MAKTTQLDETSNTYTQYLEGVQGAVVAINKDFDVTYINEFGAKMLKSNPDKLVGKKCYDLFKTKDCKTPKCVCAIAMKKKKQATAQTRNSEMRIWNTGSPLCDDKGKVIGAVEYLVDITSLKKEVELAEKQAQYLQGAQASIVAINKDFEVTFLNEYAASLLGSTPDKFIGKKCYNLYKTEDCKTPKCACAIAMKNKKPETSETISDGKWHIRYTGSPLFDNTGKVIGAIESVVDITEIKQMLENTQSLVQVSTSVSDNIAGLSTEILSTAENIGAMGAQSAQASERLSNTMEQVMAASQNVSDGAQSLSKLAQETQKNVQVLMQKMTNVSTNTEEVNKIVDTSNKVAQEASENGKEALKSLNAIKAASSDVGITISEVNASVKNVAGLADDISQIAGQINMLALNAAIEAARAGEAGRGFAVVADAVKQLAGQAGTAAKTSVESIDTITKAGERAGTMSKSADQAAVEGDMNVNDAVTGSQKVAESMQQILGVTKNLQAAVQESVRYLEDVGGVVEQVASFSEESASASEQTAASIEEQTAATEEVAVAATKVQEEVTRIMELAKKIESEVKMFKDMWQ
ncbi:MAG: PAS domain-containing protein [Candidatus Bathyarchaeota archaeon]|nr:methyl-accepting chemotaxis protein [Candidatus Bathyarchaeum tardum]WGM90031.1 MAG: methyl-accepting chemotaxis protein [Candidatus Bathyarchaeum tardum]WNZ29827.1 MAG: PAS domain-containing protein [Candidatus Bathyarchaeota archaeon]